MGPDLSSLQSLQGPCQPAAAVPAGPGTYLAFPYPPGCAFPSARSSPAKIGRLIINMFLFPLVPPRLCSHRPWSGTHKDK